MTRTRSSTLVLALPLALAVSCKGKEPAPAPAQEASPIAAETVVPSKPEVANAKWQAHTRTFLDEFFTAHPAFAVVAGRHEFDGKLPDWSPEGLAKEVARMKAAKTALAAFTDDQLSADERLQRDLLDARLDRDLFWIETAKWPQKNPAFYFDWLLDGLDPAGPDFIHLQIEAAKLAYADRETFYGDPKFTDIPIETLLSDAYNNERRKLISKDKASLDFRPGSVAGFGGVVKLRRAEGHREAVGAMGAGEPTVGRFGEVRGDTVHFDIIDKAGNMISATPSGGWLQSSPVIPEIGFCLGSRAQMFWLEENHPASLAPGKRPRTTLSPTMALRDGEPYLSWGSPGGDQQDQWITQFFLRHVHAKLNLQEAIDAPAWHSEHFPISFWPRTSRPGVLVLENRVPKSTIDELKRRGHVVEIGPDWSEGRLTAASKVGPRRRAAANPRGMQGYAAGR